MAGRLYRYRDGLSDSALGSLHSIYGGGGYMIIMCELNRR